MTLGNQLLRPRLGDRIDSAAAGRGLVEDRASMLGDDPLAQRQTETAAAGFGGEERREENVVQDNAVLVGLVVFERACVARLDRARLSQQDRLARLVATSSGRTFLAGASLYGLVAAFLSRKEATEVFVTRAQLRRVMAVFVPTLLFCLATQFLGLYVASFLLISGFMAFVGKIAWWKSLLTAFVFTAVMFITFDVAFDVIMPKGPLEAAFGY